MEWEDERMMICFTITVDMDHYPTDLSLEGVKESIAEEYHLKPEDVYIEWEEWYE